MEFNDKQAIYLQIADLICENILSDKWKEAERIPSVREVAGDIEVNPNTVMRSYNYLQDKEIIFNKRGIGYFVDETGKAKVLEIKKDNFKKEVLPEVFKDMDLLGISINEIVGDYEKYSNQQSTI